MFLTRFPALSSEPPRVTLNVGPVLTLTVGQDQKITCEAGGYHPLDVDMVWHKNDPVVSGQRVGAPLPTVLTNTLLSSHKHNSDMTFAVTSFFYLTASLSDSGKEYTCIVAHQSLRMPIRKSFVLNVVGKKWTRNTVITLQYYDLPHGGSRWLQVTSNIYGSWLVLFLFLI